MVTQPPRSDRAGDVDRPVALIATTASEWGPIHVAVTERGVAAVTWMTPIEEVRATLARRLHGPIVEATSFAVGDRRRQVIARVVERLEQWQRGEPVEFDVPIDLADRPVWDQEVLAAVRTTPWGELTSYGAIARLVGRPGAGRAVGGAVGRNPIGILVPCHRVIAADGSLGGYGSDAWGGFEERLALKRRLLALEGHDESAWRPAPPRRQARGTGRIG